MAKEMEAWGGGGDGEDSSIRKGSGKSEGGA